MDSFLPFVAAAITVGQPVHDFAALVGCDSERLLCQEITMSQWRALSPRRRRCPAPAHLLLNVLSIPAVDLDLPFDSRIGLRCCGPVVRAFRPEWDRSANQSSGEPITLSDTDLCSVGARMGIY